MGIYDKIKRLCKEKGVSVSAVERELGFARGSLCKIDKNKPSGDRITKLANYFGKPLDFFVEGLEVQTLGQQKEYYDDETLEFAQALRDNPDLRALMKAAMDVPKESQTSLTQLLHSLKETNPNG